MFTKHDKRIFAVAGVLITAGFVLMAFDPAPNGFGIATLWVAPPLLVAGFFLPLFGIAGRENIHSGDVLGKELRHLFGFMAFLIALVVYIFTLEPTASLWDCSEFIASAYKLQVPHTPGTPLSLLIGRLFTMLTFGNVTWVAWTLNFMSAVFSALTVFLVYHTIFYLGKQIVSRTRNTNAILILSSLGGSLCLAFSDTFWFSAVEAETYGAACFFLMLLVWLILTGRDLAEPQRARRLIMIFYLAGLSYCIHPMCLLAIPMLPFTWVTANRRPAFRETVLLWGAGLLIVLGINRFVAVGSFELAFALDRIFVNTFGMPFYSGAAILAGVVVLLSHLALRKGSSRSQWVWSFIFLLLGFMPYLLLFIRSNHNPPIDETNPENLALIKAYMNRESYPSSPLLYGPYFDAKVVDVAVRKEIYFKDESGYSVAGTLPEYVYDSRQTLLPRIYSNDPAHIETYKVWTGLRENERPDFYHNLKFMFAYQLGHGYFRYLMWNFTGREGDEQDSSWRRPWSGMAHSHFEKARNQYWMIPLLFGIAGALFQCRRDRRGFLSVTFFFLITGTILALYLNAPPNEPRERDYIYVGSFIAFCIWIGLGFMFAGECIRKFSWSHYVVAGFCIGAPCWMAYQNYDDHNRSGRTFQVDNARNTLRSCAPHSILFTGGDNDTFPLWYLQEVEGFRTDVRVMVLSYMNTDWYINQLRRHYYDSGEFRFTLDEEDYRQYGANDVLYVNETIKEGIDMKQFLELLKREHPALTGLSRNGEPYHILPSRILKIAVPQATLARNGSATSSPTGMRLHVTENYLSKNLLAILDLIVSNGWQRPVYFNFTSMNTLGVDVSHYVVQEGPVFRLTPEMRNGDEIAVDTTLSYRNLVVNADYSNLNDADVYFSYEDHFARMITPIRHSFNDLAREYLNQGNPDGALRVLRAALDRLYPENLPPSYTNIQAAEMLLALDEKDLADKVVKPAFDYYYSRIKDNYAANTRPANLDLYLATRSADLLAGNGHREYREVLGKLKF